MIDLGIIRESKSAYASPALIVKKPDGSSRVCVYYRRLHKMTVFDSEAMATAEELFKKLIKDTFFSKILASESYR